MRGKHAKEIIFQQGPNSTDAVRWLAADYTALWVFALGNGNETDGKGNVQISAVHALLKVTPRKQLAEYETDLWRGGGLVGSGPTKSTYI